MRFYKLIDEFPNRNDRAVSSAIAVLSFVTGHPQKELHDLFDATRDELEKKAIKEKVVTYYTAPSYFCSQFFMGDNGGRDFEHYSYANDILIFSAIDLPPREGAMIFLLGNTCVMDKNEDIWTTNAIAFDQRIGNPYEVIYFS